MNEISNKKRNLNFGILILLILSTHLVSVNSLAASKKSQNQKATESAKKSQKKQTEAKPKISEQPAPRVQPEPQQQPAPAVQPAPQAQPAPAVQTAPRVQNAPSKDQPQQEQQKESRVVSDAVYAKMLSSGVKRKALDYSLEYFKMHSSKIDNKNYLTLIDYGLASSQERFYLFNLKTGEFEKHLVSHGRNSGDLMAKLFSNKNESNMSSLGFYRGSETYSGKHGHSLRLDGLSNTNSLARERAVVIHGANANISVNKNGRWTMAPYVSKEAVKQLGRLGRSNGCPALDERISTPVINKIKNGSLIYGFHDSTLTQPLRKEWVLKNSENRRANNKRNR